MISAAVVMWTGGSEAVDPVGRVFAGVDPLSVEAVIPEAGVDLLEEVVGVGKVVQAGVLAASAISLAEAKASEVMGRILQS